MEPDPFDTTVGARVLVAFERDGCGWRTLGGIAREAHLTKREVADFLDKYGDRFVQSSVKPGGAALYGIRPDAYRHTRAGATESQVDRAAR